jgi:hypothetical protein
VSYRKVRQPHGLRVTMSRVESTGVIAQPVHSLQSFHSHLQLYDSFRVTTSQHDSVSYESQVESHIATVKSQVISHKSRSCKETVQVMSHFCDTYIPDSLYGQSALTLSMHFLYSFGGIHEQDQEETSPPILYLPGL